MSERIIDQFEPVQVQVQQGKIISVFRQLAQSLGNFGAKQDPVWQVGQRVVVSQEANAGLGLLALCDILIGGYPATVW